MSYASLFCTVKTTSPASFSITTNKNITAQIHLRPRSLLLPSRYCNPLSSRSLIERNGGRIVKAERRRESSVVSYAAPLTARNLQFISSVSSVVLLLAKGTGVQKSFVIPFFALQAPASIIAWMQGRYGLWSAFLALMVRLFFHIPGELELPFVALLLVIVTPYEVMNLRGTQQGAIISLLIAGYLAFQHFSRSSLQKAFDQGSIVPTLAVICITVSSLLLLI